MVADPETDPDSEADRDVLEELASLPTLAHPTVSPDGDRVAYYHDVTGRNELHVLDVETGESERWSAGEVPRNARWFVRWDADGERVYFHDDAAGDEQNDVYAIDEAGQVDSIVETDGQNVLQAVDPNGEFVVAGSTRDGQMNCYRHDPGDGSVTQLTDYDRAVWGATMSPDGQRIAYTTNETDDYDNLDVYVASVDSLAMDGPAGSEDDRSDARNLEIGEVGAEAGIADWHPDGDRLLVSDNTEDLTRCGVYDLEADSVRWLGDLSHEEQPECFDATGDRVVVTRTRDATTTPVVYDLDTGDGRELDLPEGVASFGMAGETVIDEDRLLLTHTTPTRRPDLLAYDLTDDTTETLVAADHGPFSPADFADAEYLTFDSDGVPAAPAEAVNHDPYETLEIGALLYDSGERPSPLIVNPHGGPRGRDSKAFDLYTQVLVQQGFSVLQVNYRGSTGRGREFVEALYDDWGGAEQGDVAVGVEHVLEEYEWLDDDRIAVFGGSYGGYSAYWQLVQYPSLYDAGVAWIGLTDLEEMYETTMPHFRTELMEKYLGTPDEHPELYTERSPITHAENLAAPLFLVHGVNDRRVPVSQARLFRDRLEELGYVAGEDGDFEYEELGEEGHASSDIDQKKRMFRLLVDFLSRRVEAA
ncbi:S9 family peptidase [Natronomonas salina]|uniref:S9 family peptidase n=1 Tax=Natronomonas salina TaxID=1710540 RepID=UPI0015B6B60C|nr:prolyl oligopeptidase family serine peptidase [Natronomonas salina]QLD90757.1 S9 family peptidase [Natronomonas salina]